MTAKTRVKEIEDEYYPQVRLWGIWRHITDKGGSVYRYTNEVMAEHLIEAFKEQGKGRIV